MISAGRWFSHLVFPGLFLCFFFFRQGGKWSVLGGSLGVVKFISYLIILTRFLLLFTTKTWCSVCVLCSSLWLTSLESVSSVGDHLSVEGVSVNVTGSTVKNKTSKKKVEQFLDIVNSHVPVLHGKKIGLFYMRNLKFGKKTLKKSRY